VIDDGERKGSNGRSAVPNYAARRMLVGTIGITAIVAAGVLGWQLTRPDRDTAEHPTAAWNTVGLIDRATGNVVTLDTEGNVAGRQTGAGRVTAAYSSGARVALVGATSIAFSAANGAVPTTITIERGSQVTPLATAGALGWLAIGQAAGGSVVLADVRSGLAIDVGALAAQSSPRLYAETIRHDAEGTVFAVADAANFQTIVVTAAADRALFFPDVPVAVAPGFVVTSQVVGQQSDVTLYDLTRKPLATVPVGLPAGGVIDTERKQVTLVDIEGVMTRFGEGDDVADPVGAVALPAGATIRLVQSLDAGKRLALIGDTFQALVDLDGVTLASAGFSDPVDLPSIAPDWACLPLGGGDTYTSIVSIESGEVLADLTGLQVTGITTDGCTVIGKRGQDTELVSEAGTVSLGPTRMAALAPDGTAVVRHTTSGSLELVPIEDGEAGDPVDMSAASPPNPLIAFLQR
jgi:hypothetical protein